MINLHQKIYGENNVNSPIPNFFHIQMTESIAT
jgi:hypothetical protein